MKDQALGFTALPICVSECSGHKIGTGIARYSPTNNFAREQVENHTKVKPVSIDFKVCNVADPNLIRTLSGKLSFQKILFEISIIISSDGYLYMKMLTKALLRD